MPGNKTIAIANQKGGVGKTAITQHLGVGIANQGKKVLLIDLDPQGNLTSRLGFNKAKLENTMADLIFNHVNEDSYDIGEYVYSTNGVDLIPSNIKLSAVEPAIINVVSREFILKEILQDIRKDYDYVLIDCSPSLGFLTVNALAAANSVIIPVNEDDDSLDGLKMLTQSINKVKRQINPELRIEGIVQNMVDMRTRLARSSRDALREACNGHVRLFDTVLPFSIRAKEIVQAKKTLFTFDKDSKLAQSFERLTREVLKDAPKARDKAR